MRPPVTQPLAALCLTLACCAPGCQPKAAPIDETCTGQTPLVPGVPGSPGHLIASETNPNGQSELALLMRRLVADWRGAQGALREHKPLPKLAAAHARIRCAWPTDAADRDTAFDGLAVNYLTAVRNFDTAPSVGTYNKVIASCRACHEVSCGGPLVVIDSLRLAP